MNAGKMLVDCRKVRDTLEKWRAQPENHHWYLLGIQDNERHRIMGKGGGQLVDFRPIDREIMIKLTTALGVPNDYFEASEADEQKWEARKRSTQNAAVSAEPLANVDSTPKAPAASDRVEALHSRLEGFYEVYHHATSRRKKNEISIFLLEVRGIDHEHNAICCELHDKSLDRPYFYFRGRIVELNGFLYWELRTKQNDAICYCCSYVPSGEKYPGHSLFGIFLTTSGDDKRDYPVAAKAAIRFIGETPDEAIQNCVVDLKGLAGDAEELLKSRIGGYLADFKKLRLLRTEILESINSDIIPEIKNEIDARSVPKALVMPRELHKPTRATKRRLKNKVR
jgi:hypothetical protein